MKIGKNTFVSLGYELTVDGEQIEKVGAESPLEFIFGSGYLLPQFEANIVDKKVGDKFAFRLEPEVAYGPVVADALVELPKDIFMIDGAIEEGLLEIGNQLPMADNQGNTMVGVVKSVNDDTVTMDFNHPLAGKALEFKGEVLGVREVTPEDILAASQMMAGGGCGCGDGCDCGDDCDCDENKEGCGCGVC